MIHKAQGFTLIEILVFVAVFSFVTVYILSAVLYTSNNMKQTQLRTLASHENGELIEWMTYKKKLLSYNGLIAAIWPLGDSGLVKTFCFNSVLSATDDWPNEGTCPDFTLKNVLKREVVATLSDNLELDIVTTWEFLSSTSSASARVYFSNY